MLCTYNGERFLEAQINSLLQQDWPNMEIVVSDDCSQDGTPAILQNFVHDARFRIFFQEQNLGAIGNFDFAVRQARGAFIAFSDQDDIWVPGKLRVLHGAMQTSELAYSDSLLVNEDGESLGKKLSDIRHMYSGSDTRGFVFSNVVWGHAMMIRRSLLQHALPIPPMVPHDIWLAVKAAASTGITYVNEVLTHYRQHSATVTTTIARKAEARPRSARIIDFDNKLNWISLLRTHGGEEYNAFFTKLEALYAGKAQGKFSWPLFYFLATHANVLFRFTRKSFLSRIIEIRKQSRGERA